MIIGDFSVSRPSAPLAPADSDLIQPEFWAIPQDGDPFVIAEVGDFDIAGIAGSRGAVSIEVPTKTVIHDLLVANTVDMGADLEIEIRLFGGQARSLRGFLSSSEADEVAEGGTRTFSGSLMAQRLYEARLDPNPTDPKSEWHFAGKNAGQIVLTLMQHAKARGAVTDIDTSTFNTANDSNGRAWAANTTITLPPGQYLMGELLEEFEEMGLCEWEVTGFRELKLFVPGTRGTDRTIGQSGSLGQGQFGTAPFGTAPFGGVAEIPNSALAVLHRGRDIVDAPRSYDVRESITNLLVAGKEGLYQTANDPSAEARRGRRIEGFASAGQIDNAAALTGYAQNRLAALTPPSMELTHGLVCNGNGGPVPFLDINLGDWIWSDTGRGAGPERLRVQQVSISRRSGELQAQAVVGTLSMSAVVALNRRLARLERGTTVVGTTEADPAAGGADVTPPAAPTGLVATSMAYQDTPTGETLAMVTVGWEPVTTDARADLSPRAQAAQLILDRVESGAGVLDDWTWHGCPQLVADHNDALIAEFAADGNTGDLADVSQSTLSQWLQDYITEAEAAISDPVVTDDVSGYRLRWANVGLGQIGGLPSSDPFEGDVLAYYEPQGSPTTATSLTFGDPGAGRDIRVQVAAFDRSGNQSVWSNPLTFTTALDNTPPPVTSAPQAATWFRTMDVYWDGLSVDGVEMLTAAPDFDHVAVIVAQAASFVAPPMVGDPVAFDPLLTGAQWVANLYGAGTYNIANLPVGVGWYVMFVAVDRGGNVSGESAITGPITAQRLVQIDIGPDAIGRAQIIDGEIVRAKIEDLAVNSAKIEEVQVGLLRAGTMTATVTNSGLFRTASTGNRIEFDSAGLRLFRGTDVVGRWQTTDASMLMTGVFQTGLTGERLMMFTDGTLRFYPVAGTNYSQISNFGNDVVWRGPLDANGRSGRFNVNVLGCGMNFSAETEIPNNLRSEVVCFDRRIRTRAPFTSFEIDGRLSTPANDQRRIQFSQLNSSGALITQSIVQYVMSTNSLGGGFSGQNAGIKFEGGQVLVCGDYQLNSFGPIRASDFTTPSSRVLKENIVDLPAALGARHIDIARQLRPVEFSYKVGVEGTRPRHIGMIVEEVADVAPQLVVGLDKPVDRQALSPMGLATLAVGAASDNADDIADLRRRLEALESA
jgi:hypothetical protein